MDRETAKYFISKRVRVTTNKDWYYKGIVKEIGTDGLIIDDIKNGITFIDYTDIKNVESWSGGEF